MKRKPVPTLFDDLPSEAEPLFSDRVEPDPPALSPGAERYIAARVAILSKVPTLGMRSARAIAIEELREFCPEEFDTAG